MTDITTVRKILTGSIQTGVSGLSRRGDRPLEDLTASELKSTRDLADRATAFICSRVGVTPAAPALSGSEGYR